MYNIFEGKNGRTLERNHIRLKAGMDQTGFSLIMIARKDTITGDPSSKKHYVNVLSHRMWMNGHNDQIMALLLAITEVLVMFNPQTFKLNETTFNLYRNRNADQELKLGINFTLEFLSPVTNTPVKMILRYVELAKLCKAMREYFNISTEMLLEWRAE